MGTAEMHPRVLRGLADAVANSLSKLWSKTKSPVTGKKGNITTNVKKHKEEAPGNYWLVNLPAVPSKIRVQILLEDMSKHMEDEEVVRHRWHGFTNGNLFLNHLVAFYDGVTVSMDKEGLQIFSIWTSGKCPVPDWVGFWATWPSWRCTCL